MIIPKEGDIFLGILMYCLNFLSWEYINLTTQSYFIIKIQLLKYITFDSKIPLQDLDTTLENYRNIF